MKQHDPYRDARRAVERKLGFLIHLAVYLVVNAGLFVLDILHHGSPQWSFFPLLGWGIGLLCHGLSVFLHTSCAEWKRSLIEKELRKRNLPPTA